MFTFSILYYFSRMKESGVNVSKHFSVSTNKLERLSVKTFLLILMFVGKTRSPPFVGASLH